MMEAVGLVDPALVEQAAGPGPPAPADRPDRRLPVCGPAGVGVGG